MRASAWSRRRLAIGQLALRPDVMDVIPGAPAGSSRGRRSAFRDVRRNAGTAASAD
jgi:hypothetical protein